MAAQSGTKEWQTKISRVIPNKVILRGYSHEELIGNVSYPEGVFLTLRGRLPTPAEARMTEAFLVSLLDHGFVAASVLAARYAASGNPQLVPAVAAGLLTAGANTIAPQHSAEFIESAHRMMRERNLSRQQAAQQVVAEVRARRARIPGFGHPVHKEEDFRAARLRAIAQECGFVGEKLQLYEAIHDEFIQTTGRRLCINVDGMMAAIMLEMGFKPMEMTAIALLSVLPGVMGHVIEEIEEGKPLRVIPDEQMDYLGEPERPLPKR